MGDAWDWFKLKLPAIGKHLFPYKEKAQKRSDMGDYWWELRACAYLHEFENEKIVYNDICQKLTFSFVEKNVFFNNTAYFINSDSKYLIAILNSNLIDWYYRKLSVQLGEKAVRMFSIYVEKIPIPEVSQKFQQPFIDIAEMVISKKEKNEDTLELENQLDHLVYQLYDLTEEEIAIIERA